jgi:outer membrane lipoprotein SlyB
MKRFTICITLTILGLLQACAPAATPQAQQARQHEIACVSGTIAGAIIGGAIGNQFGGGRGQDILTAGGAGAGAVAGQRYACG